MNYELMGKNIAKKRIANHLTQEQLAEKIDVSTVFISQIENAIRKPSLETVSKLASALNTTIDSLVGNEDIRAKHDKILSLLQEKNSDELEFILKILHDICTNTKNGKISINNSSTF